MKIFEFIDKMAMLKRWNQVNCNKTESVLEHTGFVAVYALYLCKMHDLDVGAVLERAVVHDFEEIITGDIPTPTKYANPIITAAIDEVSKSAARDVSNMYFSGTIFYTWENAKNYSTIAGKAIALSDCAAVAYKIRQEFLGGNEYFLEYIPNTLNALSKMRAKFDGSFEEEIDELITMLGELV